MTVITSAGMRPSTRRPGFNSSSCTRTSSLPALERYPPIPTGSPSPGIQRDQAEWHCQGLRTFAEKLSKTSLRCRPTPVTSSSHRRVRAMLAPTPPEACHETPDKPPSIVGSPAAATPGWCPNPLSNLAPHPCHRVRECGRALLGLADRAQSVNHVSGVLASSMTRRSSARKIPSTR